MNGREPCPECSVRDTEKVGRWRFECHSCGHEWRGEEAREVRAAIAHQTLVEWERD